MLLKKNKKILIYISLLMLITTINNKNIKYINLTKINKINVTGLEEVNNLKLKKKIEFFKN